MTSLEDCDDHDGSVPSSTVVLDNGPDNDCDGIADNLRQGPIPAAEADVVVQASFVGMFPSSSNPGDSNGDGVLDPRRTPCRTRE